MACGHRCRRVHPCNRGKPAWLPFLRWGMSPVVYRDSIFVLPSTLRAVKGCEPTVRTPINSFHLAGVQSLHCSESCRIKPLLQYTGCVFAFCSNRRN